MNLKEGEYFSVVVQFTNPNTGRQLAAKKSLPNYYPAVVNEGESYYVSYNSQSSMPYLWWDFGKNGYNVHIKAFTVPEPPLPINAENFPDNAFRDYISENFGFNKDNALSKQEIAEVKKIDAHKKESRILKA